MSDCPETFEDEYGQEHECSLPLNHTGQHICGKMWAGEPCNRTWSDDVETATGGQK